jgi:hypothetical protein
VSSATVARSTRARRAGTLFRRTQCKQGGVACSFHIKSNVRELEGALMRVAAFASLKRGEPLIYGVPLAEVDTLGVDKPGAVRVESCS